jgi:hypothetical protein
MKRVVLFFAFLWLGIIGVSAQVDRCDVNGDGEVDIVDVTYVINHILGKGEASTPEAVDLGLPSGTKWASFNVGATKPEEYGGYYAWGETEEKERYDWDTYIHCDGASNTCHDLGSDISGTQYDIAHVKWGGNWCMPTYEDFEELNDNCTSEWTTLNGVNGRKFTGPNGNSIFLPAAGSYWHSNLSQAGSNGEYWSSTLSWDSFARGFSFYSGRTQFFSCDCYVGNSVRPVMHTPTLTISIRAVFMEVDECTTIKITDGSGDYTVENVDGNVAVATLQGTTITINAYSIGDASVVVTDVNTGQQITVTVTVMRRVLLDIPGEAIDLGLPSGTKWASCNVGTTTPEEYGGYYAWGETEEKKFYDWGSYIHCDGTEDSCHDLGSDISGTEYDVAHVKWGGNWCMPSMKDIKELLRYCTTELTTLNGVNGIKVTSKNNGNSIFLPSAGEECFPDFVGSCGFYWSSTQDPYSRYVSDVSETAGCLIFGTDSEPSGADSGIYTRYSVYTRSCGLSVRPVIRD